MDALNISTGTKRIPVVRDGAQAGELVFNPSDVVFAEKFYKLIGEFEKQYTQYQAQARALEKNDALDANDIPANTVQRLQLVRDSCEFAYVQIDALFGTGTSAMVFGDSMIPDAIMQFFEGVAPFVQRVRTEKMQKYTNGHKKPRKRK